MKSKCISLRFNLETEDERQAWENLQAASGVKNRIIIEALNSYFQPKVDIAEIIRRTIAECLSAAPLPVLPAKESSHSEGTDEDEFMDVMDDFMMG